MRLKKTLAFALAIAMVFGIVSFAAAAPAAHGTAFADVAADHPKAKQITALGALGLAVGDSGVGGNFNPDSTLTRAEFAVFAVRLAGLEDTAKALGNFKPTFNDANAIPEWAYGYINVAQSEGIVVGDDRGNFNANADVTYAEALTMLVRVAGWQDTVTGSNWPTNYMTRAIALGVSKDVSLTANAAIVRSDMAALVYNAGDLDKPETKDGKWTGEKIANSSPFSGQSKKGLLSNYDPVRGTVLLGSETLNLADDVYLSGFSSIAAATGRDVRVLISAKKVAYIEASAAGVDVAGVFDETKDVTTADGDEIGYIVLKDGTQVEFDGDTKVSLNGGPANKKVADLKENDRVEITTESGVAASVAATRYQLVDELVTGKPHAKAANDVTDYNYVPVVDGQDYKIRTDRATITLNGEAVSFDELAENDVVRVAIVNGDPAGNGKSAHRIDATRQTMEGVVADRFVTQKTDGKYYVTVGLKLADSTTKSVDWVGNFATDTAAEDATPAEDVRVVLFLNADGKAADYDDQGISKIEYAKLVSRSADGSKVQLDILGTVGTYEVNIPGAADPKPVSADLGKLGAFKLANGKLTEWTVIADLTDYDEAEVVNVNVDAGILTVKDAGGYWAEISPVVYAQSAHGSSKAGKYLGLEGLKAKDKVLINWTAADTAAIMKAAAAPSDDTTVGELNITSDIPSPLATGYTWTTTTLTATDLPNDGTDDAELDDGTLVSNITVTITRNGAFVASPTATGTDVDEVEFTLPANLPVGTYEITLSFQFDGETYSAKTSFKVQ